MPQARLALVCSARSGSTKALGTTNLLLKAAAQALEGDKTGDDLSSSIASLKVGGSSSSSSSASTSDLADSTSSLPSPPQAAFEQTIDVLLREHLAAVDQAVRRDADLRARLEADVRADCERLRQFLQAAKIIEEISSRSKDIILSLGERLSCRLVCGALQDLGIPSELVGMESVIDATFLDEVTEIRRKSGGVSATQQTLDGESHLDQHFYDHLATKMGERCRAARGVPVVTGEW